MRVELDLRMGMRGGAELAAAAVGVSIMKDDEDVVDRNEEMDSVDEELLVGSNRRCPPRPVLIES
jgi:hypothetical protein